MPTPTREVFVQVGATRDGLDPYLDAASRRGYRTVLVETPVYLRRRRVLGRRSFDEEIGVGRPEDPAAVRAALSRTTPALVLAGFERYVGSAAALAELLGCRPFRTDGHFAPPDKEQQRRTVASRAPGVAQPWYRPLPDGPPEQPGIRYPCVVKPTDGGGGLGVFLADGPGALRAAVARLREMQNYGGGDFAGLLVEEFVAGVEHSLQGVVRAGRVHVLTECQKVIAQEDVPGQAGLRGFREIGHVGIPGAHAAPDLRQVAEAVVAAVGFPTGPFHADLIRRDGRPLFLEMGFRLSGGSVVDLVRRVTGADWADLAFAAYLDEPWSPPPAAAGAAGQIEVFDAQQIAVAEALRAEGRQVDVVRRAPAGAGAVLSGEERRQLGSDLARHAGGAGKVIVAGADADEVWRLLDAFTGARAPR